jgi:hypothetical protein
MLRGRLATSTDFFLTPTFNNSIWDTVAQQWTRPSGTFAVHVGASSRDIRLEGSL